MPHEAVLPGDAFDRLLACLVDPGWYQTRYPDVAATDIDPVLHFIRFGFAELRDPNRLFDGAWYQARYPDVAASGLIPVGHYLQAGAGELRNPHPQFDARFYVREHPEAAANPLLYHLQTGLARGYLSEPAVKIRDYLPADGAVARSPPGVFADVVIPVRHGDRGTRRCLLSVLADRSFPLARIIVIEDACGNTELVAWLGELAAESQIHLIRNARRRGFGASVRQGIEAADVHDVVVLPSDAEVCRGWVSRLAAHAWSNPRVATVSPLSNPASGCASRPGVATFGQPPALLDDICRTVNVTRSVAIPTASGNCLYIRRAALREAGPFTGDHGSERGFCRRATAAGWQHRLACDSFVQRGCSSEPAQAKGVLSRPRRASDHEHKPATAADPFCFAVTAALFRQSNLPVILMVSHDIGGGVRRHIHGLVERHRGDAYFLLLEGTDRGVALSVPAEPDHPVLRLPSGRMDDLVLVLRSAKLSRVHIHHQLHLDFDLRRLIHRLGVPFDVTVHDYYAICPQINLLPWPEGSYCGEPSLTGCNACIAALSSHGARDIVSWRREKAWQFIEADRVICPSADVRDRLVRHGLGSRTIVAPHERQTVGDWPVSLPDAMDRPLRIALLGVLANHKGARAVAAVAEAAEHGAYQIHLIGDVEASFPKAAKKFIEVTGHYEETELDELVVRTKPHVFWFPSSAPETYSYTLSTAITSGLPIVATRLGAFPERLAGRPNTWLVDHDASTQDLLATFAQVAARLRDPQPPPPALRPPTPRPPVIDDFYGAQYLLTNNGRIRSPGRIRQRAARRRIVVCPERADNASLTPNAYVRLLQPLDHPMISGEADVIMTTSQTVCDAPADIIVTQRFAITDVESADRLAAHARHVGAKLVYDLDEDLLTVPSQHPDAPRLRLQAKTVRRMLKLADAVWLATPGLARRLAAIRPDAIVVETRLDERIWTMPAATAAGWEDPVRILCMGAASESRNFALIAPALTRLKREYGPRIVIDVLDTGVARELPPGLNRISPSWHATRSYPGLVNWLTAAQPAWHIGLAALLDTPPNQSRSTAEAMNYAALGLATLASDVPAHRGSIADGPAGQLVRNDRLAWHAALDWLIRDRSLRRSLGEQARRVFAARGTLASQAEQRRSAWTSLLAGPGTGLRGTAGGLTIAHDQTHPAA